VHVHLRAADVREDVALVAARVEGVADVLCLRVASIPFSQSIPIWSASLRPPSTFFHDLRASILASAWLPAPRWTASARACGSTTNARQ
jgi:hypothetical protein